MRLASYSGMKTYRISMDEVRERHTGQWFTAGAMKFFSSRLESEAWEGPGGTYFVSSEKFTSPRGVGPRRFSVRTQNENGSINTVGEFQGYATREAADAEAERLAGSTDHPKR